MISLSHRVHGDGGEAFVILTRNKHGPFVRHRQLMTQCADCTQLLNGHFPSLTQAGCASMLKGLPRLMPLKRSVDAWLTSPIAQDIVFFVLRKSEPEHVCGCVA